MLEESKEKSKQELYLIGRRDAYLGNDKRLWNYFNTKLNLVKLQILREKSKELLDSLL